MPPCRPCFCPRPETQDVAHSGLPVPHNLRSQRVRAPTHPLACVTPEPCLHAGTSVSLCICKRLHIHLFLWGTHSPAHTHDQPHSRERAEPTEGKGSAQAITQMRQAWELVSDHCTTLPWPILPLSPWHCPYPRPSLSSPLCWLSVSSRNKVGGSPL